MSSHLIEVHFWSTSEEEILISDYDFGTFRYHDRKEPLSCTLESKKSYAERRGLTWTTSSKKSNGVSKDALRELEEQLSLQRMVKCEWQSLTVLQVFLSSGLLVSVHVHPATGDVTRLVLDKYLVGKLASENITHAALSGSHVALSYGEGLLSLVHMARPCSDKLSHQEPQLSVFELQGAGLLEGGTCKRVERWLVLNASSDMLLVWWKGVEDEVLPWSPVLRDAQERANLLVYSLHGACAELICSYHTGDEPIAATFCDLQPNVIQVVEQSFSRKGGWVVSDCRLEVTPSGLQRRSVTTVPVKSQVCCHARSPDELRLLLGCLDSSLLLLQTGATTLLVHAAFTPHLVSWHPEGALVAVASARGQVQTFDLALACVPMQLLGKDPAPLEVLNIGTYLRVQQPTLVSLKWNQGMTNLGLSKGLGCAQDSFLAFLFDSGPLGIVRMVGSGCADTSSLCPSSLVSLYLNQGPRSDLQEASQVGGVEASVRLLARLSWDTEGAQCFACLQKIVNHLLRTPLTSKREDLLEAALGTFMLPPSPLVNATVLEYGTKVHHLACRFFFHLLRHQRFEKSFRLAIDLDDRDLFVDIFHHATAAKLPAVAQAALEKADEMANLSSGVSHSASSSESSEEEIAAPIKVVHFGVV